VVGVGVGVVGVGVGVGVVTGVTHPQSSPWPCLWWCPLPVPGPVTPVPSRPGRLPTAPRPDPRPERLPADPRPERLPTDPRPDGIVAATAGWVAMKMAIAPAAATGPTASQAYLGRRRRARLPISVICGAFL
jgi:hypothetical protein